MPIDNNRKRRSVASTGLPIFGMNFAGFSFSLLGPRLAIGNSFYGSPVGAPSGDITGTGALASQASAVSGTGEITKTGTGALAAQVAQVSGTGTVLGSITGTGALAAQVAQISGTGVRAITGTGALASQAATISGSEIVVTYDEIDLTVTITREQALNMTITREVDT